AGGAAFVKPFVRTPSGSSMFGGQPGGATPDAGAAPDGAAASGATPDAPAGDAPAPDAPAPDAPAQDGDAPAQDGDAPAEDAPAAQVDKTELTTEQIDAALQTINPNFDPFELDNGFATNCGHTSSILNDVLNGQPVREAPGGSTLSLQQMADATGRPQAQATPAQIEATLRAAGAGSHCVVGIDRSSGPGHWFNAYFDGTQMWTI